MAICDSGNRPDAFRIGKTADILPPRLSSTSAHRRARASTVRRS